MIPKAGDIVFGYGTERTVIAIDGKTITYRAVDFSPVYIGGKRDMGIRICRLRTWQDWCKRHVREIREGKEI